MRPNIAIGMSHGVRSMLSIVVSCAFVLGSLQNPPTTAPDDILSNLPFSNDWRIYTVDATGNVGEFVSIALDSGNSPHVSYSESFPNWVLKYAKWNGSSWNAETVDVFGGASTSIAIDSNDNPHIGYYGDCSLRYARWNGSSWDIEVVDSSADVGGHTSIALDSSDNPHVSYHDLRNADLKYAMWNGSAWIVETVDSALDVGRFTSITLDSSDNPHIGYMEDTHWNLKYANKNGDSWSVETVDNSTRVGEFTSVALDSKDNPHISYHDDINGDLKYAERVGGNWSIEIVDSGESVGHSTSIALDSNDDPHISYGDSYNHDLRYAERDAGGWNIEVVDSVGWVGGFTSIALDTDDYPHIGYYDGTDRNLKYATKAPFPHPDGESPVADAGPDQMVNEGDVVQFDGSGSYDPDGLLFNDETLVDDVNGSYLQIYPKMSMDSENSIHVVWQDGRNYASPPDMDIYYSNSTDGGLSFSANLQVNTATDMRVEPPSIESSSDGKMCVMWSADKVDAVFMSCQGQDGLFVPEIQVSDNDAVASQDDFVVDNDGRFHVVWRDFRYGSGDIFYSNSSDGNNFSKPQRVNDDSWGSVQAAPSVSVDEDLHIHVVWMDNREGDFCIFYSNSTDGGVSFGTNTKVDPQGCGLHDQYNPSIASDGGLSHVVWFQSVNGSIDVAYARSLSPILGFEAPKTIGGDSDANESQPSISLDNQGNPHIVWTNHSQSDTWTISYARSFDLGETFPLRLGVGTQESVFLRNWPSIAVDATLKPHVVWHDMRFGWRKIYESHGYYGPANESLDFDWDFGDGSAHSSLVAPTHMYASPGVYLVNLTVTDPEGASGTDQCVVTVVSANEPPIANAGADQLVDEGDLVQFDGTGSYDPDSGEEAWVNVSNIPTKRFAVAGAVLDDELYVVGGWELPGFNVNMTGAVEKYNPATDSWSSETPIFEPHIYMGAGTASGELYAMGGFAENQSQTTNLEFDPATHTWVNKTPMPFARDNFAVAVVNDKIYLIGGSNSMIDCPTLNLVEKYDPVTDTWTQKADMPSHREGLAATVYDDKIYAIGGHAICPGDPDTSQIKVEVYDPATDTWTSARSLPTGRTELEAETLGGKIYAMGGWNSTVVHYPERIRAVNITEVYDPTTDSWSSAQPMLETRREFASGVVNGRIYVAAGHSDGWMSWLPPPDWSEEYGPGSGELEYSWDFDASVDTDGDGNYTNDVEATGPTPTHIYYDDGVYIVTLKVTDEEGQSDWDTCNITVLNVPPTPEWTSRSSDGSILNPPYPEGKEILFEATVYDPGIYDTFTYDWDFGDGTILLDAGPSVTHTYGDDDIYIVVLTVTDDDGGVGIDDTPPLETTNENPVASINMPYCIFTEGTSPCEAIGEFTDPGWLDTHSAVWDYGDGTYENAVLTGENDPPDATGMNITSHIYGDDGVYNITFTVVDDDGGVGTAWAEAQVQNLPPSLDVNAPSSVNEGEDFVLGITATDPGSDDLTVHVDWGDGTSETETHYNNGIGPDPPNSGEGVYPFTVYSNLTHVYGDNGNFTIQVTVEDDDGGSAQGTAVVEVLNLPPEIVLLAVPLYANEGEGFSLVAEATDQGSDDLEFIWTFELGPSVCGTYYNDGVGPDPPLSPWGIFPFTAEDTVNHTYGDNGYYNVTITVTDDDGGVSTSSFTIEIRNVEPSIDIGGPYAGDENSPIEFTATATNPGSDDLTFTWDWGDGTTDAMAFYNDGINADPPKSPWGTYPFSATHTLSHLWGDNGNFTVTLTVTDDDGGISVQQTEVIVENVAPTIESIEYYLNASFSFRIAGEKWHNVEIHLYEDGTEIGYANITRYPGSPNDQMATLADISIDFSKTYSAIAYYTPEDDPVNGQIWGATPAWVILEYEDGEERIHHTFNVRHEDTWTWVIDDFSPYFLGHNITFMATASDPGSDDLTFTWNWGDGNTTENVYYNDGIGPDPYPSPEVNPITVTDTARHGYSSAGTYVITLTVTDDDGGAQTISLLLAI